MDRETLNTFEEKGLPCPFIASKTGEVEIAQSGAAMAKQVSQMATVIFETIGAVGDIKVDQFEMLGSDKRLVISFSDDRLVGTIFSRSEKHDINTLLNLIQELRSQPAREEIPAERVVDTKEEVVEEKPVEKAVPIVEKEVEKEVIEEPVQEPEPEKEVAEPEVKEAKVKIGAGVLDTMKSTMKDYLGDFTERILKNQVKAQRINLDELYDDDARRLVFALGKAAGMIIGPSKGREMTNKLLELLK
jgi:hypothetical protein